MDTARYWYFKPDDPEPVPSPFGTDLTANLFPKGTQCLDTKTGRVFELDLLYQNTTPMYVSVASTEYHLLYPSLRTHALLLGVTLIGKHRG